MHYLDPTLLLRLSGKTKVTSKLKLMFVVLLLLTPLLPVLIFPVLLDRLLLTGPIMYFRHLKLISWPSRQLSKFRAYNPSKIWLLIFQHILMCCAFTVSTYVQLYV